MSTISGSTNKPLISIGSSPKPAVSRSMSTLIVSSTLFIMFVTRSAAGGITPIERWAPSDAFQFKTASVCHFQSRDDFGVFAVFSVRSDSGAISDRLWYLLVEGSSGSPDYGKIIDSVFISKEPVISHVDCTTDGGSSAYVVWDRSDDSLDTLNARWTRVDISGAADRCNEVPTCEARASWANGIAYHDGALAISGAGRAACSGCTYVWPDAGDPSTYVRNYVWFDGQTARATDVIWNGIDSFLVALLIKMDGTGMPALATVQVMPDGSLAGWELYQDGAWDDSSYKAVYLVDSDASDSSNPVFIQTDRLSFWCDSWGNFDGVYASDPMSVFPACEYRGKNHRVAHTYTFGLRNTTHLEWPASAGAPVNVYQLPRKEALYPVACGSSVRSSDPKILLIRKSILLTAKYLYCNFEPQD